MGDTVAAEARPGCEICDNPTTVCLGLCASHLVAWAAYNEPTPGYQSVIYHGLPRWIRAHRISYLISRYG